MLLLSKRKPSFIDRVVSCFRPKTAIKQRERHDYYDTQKPEDLNRLKNSMLSTHITPEKVNNAMVAIGKIRELSMLDPNKVISFKDLNMRQLFCKQLMNLKVKGKFLEETEAFVDDTGKMPSIQS